MTPDRDEVEEAIETLQQRGRSHIKSRDVADVLGVQPTRGALSVIGGHVHQIAEQREDVSEWSRGKQGGATWRIIADSEQGGVQA